jgi:RNA polymerase sigma-70 factor, ECF subfamily
MNENLDAQFEARRPRLQSVAYRLLGSLTEAEDAVQETWIRLSRSDAESIDNLGGWLTTVLSRVCLGILRSRRTQREERLEPDEPEPEVADPEEQAILADTMGPALLLLLETLTPPERLAFVLHDIFAVPFDEIAPIVDRSPEAARQLASRARRRVQGEPTVPDTDLGRQRELVDAFMAAARNGDFEALIKVLDPDVVVRADAGAGIPRELRGAAVVARNASAFQRLGLLTRPAIVNGVAGAVALREDGSAFSVGAFTVRGGRIVAIDFLADPVRLAGIDLTVLKD